MDPATLAATAVGILGPFLGKIGEGSLTRIGESITEKGLEPISRLYEAIKSRFQGDSYATAILDGAEEPGSSPARLDAVRAVLTEILEKDAEFATDIDELVAEARATKATQITDSGASAGRDINLSGKYVAGRDINF